jgi:hypothetical protein
MYGDAKGATMGRALRVSTEVPSTNTEAPEHPLGYVTRPWAVPSSS